MTICFTDPRTLIFINLKIFELFFCKYWMPFGLCNAPATFQIYLIQGHYKAQKAVPSTHRPHGAMKAVLNTSNSFFGTGIIAIICYLKLHDQECPVRN